MRDIEDDREATLHALDRRHDLLRGLIRIRIETAKAGALDEDGAAAKPVAEYEVRITTLERPVRQTGQDGYSRRRGTAIDPSCGWPGPRAAIGDFPCGRHPPAQRDAFGDARQRRFGVGHGVQPASIERRHHLGHDDGVHASSHFAFTQGFDQHIPPRLGEYLDHLGIRAKPSPHIAV